jgi:hypothetical protein
VELWELIARESIRDLVARYNANGDSGRIEQMLDLFAPDARVEVVPDRIHRGREEIRALFQGAADVHDDAPPIRFLRHHTATHQIDLLGRSEARGRCYFAVYTEEGLDHWGRYNDEYIEIDGAWRFRTRRVTVEGQVPGGWAAQRSGG